MRLGASNCWGSYDCAHMSVIKSVLPPLCGSVAVGHTKCICIPLLHCRWVVTILVWCDLTHPKMSFRMCNAVIFLAPVSSVICSTITACSQATLSSPYWFGLVDYRTFPVLLWMLTPTILVPDMIVFSFRSLAECSFAAWVFYLDMCCSPVNMILECHLKTT